MSILKTFVRSDSGLYLPDTILETDVYLITVFSCEPVVEESFNEGSFSTVLHAQEDDFDIDVRAAHANIVWQFLALVKPVDNNGKICRS